MEKLLEQANIRYTHLGGDPETDKTCIIETMFATFYRPVEWYFTLLPQICQYCNCNADSSDLQGLVEHFNINKIGEAIIYVRKHETAYSDLDILKHVFYSSTFAEINYIYDTYFNDPNRVVDWIKLCNRNYNGLDFLLWKDIISFTDLSEAQKEGLKRVSKGIKVR